MAEKMLEPDSAANDEPLLTPERTARVAQYIDDRMRRKLLRPFPDAAVAARLVIETVVFWAVHRHWDPHPQPVDEAVAKDTVVRFVVNALVKE